MTLKFSCLPTNYTPSNVALQCWFSSSWLMKAVVQVVVDLVGDFSPSSVAINSGAQNPMQSDKSYYGEQPGITLQTAFLPKDRLWQRWERRWGFLVRKCWAEGQEQPGRYWAGASLRQPGLAAAPSSAFLLWFCLLFILSWPGISKAEFQSKNAWLQHALQSSLEGSKPIIWENQGRGKDLRLYSA